MSHAYAEAGI